MLAGLLVFYLPLAVAALLSPFFGKAPLALVAITYIYLAHLVAWPFGVASEFGEQVGYNTTIERSRITECYYIAVTLEPDAQAQPFAQSAEEKNWQPRVGGPPEVQPKGNDRWLETPMSEREVTRLVRQMENCGLSAATVNKSKNALRQPGSWLAYSTREMDKVLLYSQPLDLVLVYSNET